MVLAKEALNGPLLEILFHAYIVNALQFLLLSLVFLFDNHDYLDKQTRSLRFSTITLQLPEIFTEVTDPCAARLTADALYWTSEIKAHVVQTYMMGE